MHHHNQKYRHSNSGFTLTEMLIVLALMALAASFVTGRVIAQFQKAKVSATVIQIRSLGNLLDTFKMHCGFYPLTDQGLEALVKPPAGRECKNYQPNGYINDNKVPKDGWDNDFIYESDGNKYKITSLGNDGKPGGEETDKDVSSDNLDEFK